VLIHHHSFIHSFSWLLRANGRAGKISVAEFLQYMREARREQLASAPAEQPVATDPRSASRARRRSRSGSRSRSRSRSRAPEQATGGRSVPFNVPAGKRPERRHRESKASPSRTSPLSGSPALRRDVESDDARHCADGVAEVATDDAGAHFERLPLQHALGLARQVWSARIFIATLQLYVPNQFGVPSV
jgi:hypothetical protein